MAAGNGNSTKKLKVEFLGDATDAVVAANRTERALKDVDDQADKTGTGFDGLGTKLSGFSSIVGKTAGVITLFGVAASAAVGGVALAAAGVVAAVGGIGLAFAAQNLAVAGAFGELKNDLTAGMQEVTASFVPLMLDIAGQIRSTFDGLKPALTGLFDAAAPVIGQIVTAALGGFAALVPIFTEIIGAVQPLIDVLTVHLQPVLVTIGQALLSAAQTVAGPLGSALGHILGTLSDLIAGLVEAFGPTAAALFDFLGPAIETVGTALGGILSELGPALTEVFAKLGPPIQKVLDALAPVLPMIADLAGTVLVALADAITPVIDALAPFITQLVDQLKPVFEDLKPIIQDFGTKLGPILADNVETVLPALLDLTEALLPIIPPIVDIITQFILFEQKARGAFLDVIVSICQWLQDVVPPIFDRFIDGLRRIGGWAMTVGGWISDAWTWVWDKVASFGQWAQFTAWPAIQGFVHNVLSAFVVGRDFIVGVWDTIRNKIQEVVGFVQNLPGTISNALYGMWEGLKNGFRDAINWIIDRWNNLRIPSLDVPGIGMIGGIDFPDIQRLHSGGTFRAPTAGGQGLALLRDGERVSTPGQGGPAVYVAVEPVTGKVMVRELTDHQRRGGAVPYVRVV